VCVPFQAPTVTHHPGGAGGAVHLEGSSEALGGSGSRKAEGVRGDINYKNLLKV
jgi:hypothetical protein